MVMALIGCSISYFPKPKHLLISEEAKPFSVGLFIHLAPFSNSEATLHGAIFEFRYLTSKVPTQTVYVNVPVHSNTPILLPYEGDYEVTMRAGGFKRTSFPLNYRKSSRITVEVAMEFDPGLAFELKPEFP
jgi:hypothetical protein